EQSRDAISRCSKRFIMSSSTSRCTWARSSCWPNCTRRARSRFTKTPAGSRTRSGRTRLARRERMPKLVAFLRAINVGGHTVSMDTLRREFEAIGLKDVETFIASGNVVFAAPPGKATALERKIEKRLHDSLGYEVRTFIRTEAEVAAIAGYKPFEEAQLRSAQAVNVAFLGDPLEPAAVKLLMAMRTPID